jgi:RNAse (barnase) inhibitor barstar
MDIDKWEQLKESLKQKFGIEEEGVEDLTMGTKDGEIVKGSSNFLIMQTPMGRVKLAFEKKPLVLNKKDVYSHRAGQDARTEYEFSDTEFTYKLKAYKWNDIDETWDGIDAENFS